ncbi:hypothetical protein BKA62DRAFT_739405 [Auriculariales sp. MPI-PUGE-AT-0066]|nr:hypothetical protein BKA62DRAFT_739405 [Auriculariales sp. MPI-PUGE-AT-0066]
MSLVAADENDVALSRAATATPLPLELLLSIIELLVVTNRDVSLHSTLALSTISRSVYNVVLPLAYEVLHIEIEPPQESDWYVGWNGCKYPHRSLSCLSWLLCNPDAAPRRHVRHLIFSPHAVSDFDHLPYLSRSKQQSTWTIERITYNSALSALLLGQIGISGVTTQTVARMDYPWIPSRRNYSFRWRLSESGTEFSAVMAPIQAAGVHFIELDGEEDLLGFSLATWTSLKSTMEGHQGINIVFLCPNATNALDTRTIDGLQSALPSDILKRIWLAPTTWDSDAMRKSPLLAHARMVQSGEDPWIRGMCVGSLVENRVQVDQ